MEEVWLRFIENLGDRIDGPMKLRFLLQPIMAMTLATLAGLRDARTGRPPYFWGLFTHPGQRRDMLKDGWKDVGKVIVLAFALDAVYQFVAGHVVRPREALVVAVILAIIPYLLVRGLVTRIARASAPNRR